MIEKSCCLDRRSVVCTSLDRERALSRSGTHLPRLKVMSDCLGQSQSGYTRSSQDDGVKLTSVELSHSSIYISAQRNDLEIRTERVQLCLSSQTARANARILRQLVDLRIMDGEKRISRIFPFWYCRQHKSGRELSWQVFETMYRKINAAF